MSVEFIRCVRAWLYNPILEMHSRGQCGHCNVASSGVVADAFRLALASEILSQRLSSNLEEADIIVARQQVYPEHLFSGLEGVSCTVSRSPLCSLCTASLGNPFSLYPSRVLHRGFVVARGRHPSG